MKQQRKEFTVSARYLILPIEDGGKSGMLKLLIDGKVVLDYEVALAPGAKGAGWYAFFSLEGLRGRSAEVVASGATEEGFALVRQSDTIPAQESLYKERLRPHFHFTSRSGWLNDPNGLIFYKGDYHMYYQHNPTALHWGNMT